MPAAGWATQPLFLKMLSLEDISPNRMPPDTTVCSSKAGSTTDWGSILMQIHIILWWNSRCSAMPLENQDPAFLHPCSPLFPLLVLPFSYHAPTQDVWWAMPRSGLGKSTTLCSAAVQVWICCCINLALQTNNHARGDRVLLTCRLPIARLLFSFTRKNRGWCATE